MNQNTSDCLGEGSFYRLDNDSVGSAPEQAATSGQAGSDTEIRYHPNTGEPYCIDAIIAGLRSEDWNTRVNAALDLGSKGDAEGIMPLLQALRDPHKEVRARAYEALLTLESAEPLPVRVLLSRTVDHRERTDILLGLTLARGARGSLFGYGPAKQYCENVLEQQSVATFSDAEREVMTRLKQAARCVLTELARRADAEVLLRPGDSGALSGQLLRAASGDHSAADTGNLLLPAAADDSRDGVQARRGEDNAGDV